MVPNLAQTLPPQILQRLSYNWPLLHARDDQLPPDGDWRIWLLLAGRGFGKTRAGAEWVRHLAESGQVRRIALVARTADDARKVMVEGESGLLAVCPPWNFPHYEPSRRQLTWPNGVMAFTYSSDAPDQLRGPQHDAAWCDELASWLYPAAFDNLLFGLRLGEQPRIVVTTTPRPIPLVRQLLSDGAVRVTRGTTFDNARHLPRVLLGYLRAKYDGTTLGRQELYAELLDATEGALWQVGLIDPYRVREVPALRRIVVAIDPAASSPLPESAKHAGSTISETGIIVAGRGVDGHGYVLDDVSLHGTPAQWAQRAVEAYQKWQADRIIAEVNHGGEMIAHTLRTIEPKIAVTQVRASRAKQMWAEPIVALYEQGKIHHRGTLAALEDQMTTWVPGKPGPADRLDALVWALSELMLTPETPKLTVQPNPFYPR